MTKSEAQNLVKETLEGSFDRAKFAAFTKDVLNGIEETPNTKYRGNYIPAAFRDHVKQLDRIGKYEDPNGRKLDILVIHLKKERSLVHARTMQRNFVAWYLKYSRGGQLKDAALVAYVGPGREDWRFSLVKMEYRFEDGSGDKVKIKEDLTPAKRYSFLVGKHETGHTAQSRLVPLLEQGKNPTLDELEEAFSIEKVTKEFYEKYRELFLRLKDALDVIVEKDKRISEDFKDKHVDTADFTKNLLGQIIFLYFLQKKGWFGVERDVDWGFGPKDFLRRLFNKENVGYDNFFNDILEPLFYEALRSDRSHDDGYYSRLDCRIPFLNGGLFDPLGNYDWVKTEILFSNELFSNDEGTGVLDIFDLYNFTVKEDEPLEKEVAVDPEMLGKVFENLLEVKNRRDKGTYYTPREIVHYMCQQSLISYLENKLDGAVSRESIGQLVKFGEMAVEHDGHVAVQGKETKTYSFKLPEDIRANARVIDAKLKEIRVCDPAVGSGAFPVGMMSEIIRTRNALTTYYKSKRGRTMYDFKRHAVQHCLYGVDIDPGAIEIAKLRLWLSLIVDEESIADIKPLPNLDYKLMVGNSLVEMLPPDGESVSGEVQRDKITGKLGKLKDEFFEETLPEGKKKKRTTIDKTLIELFEFDKKARVKEFKEKIKRLRSQATLFEDKAGERQRETTIKELKQKIIGIRRVEFPGPTEHFEWHLNFSEAFKDEEGFDVIIANPPYLKERDNKKVFETIQATEWGRKWHQGKMDLWFFFLHRAVDMTRTGGVISFITSRYWLNSTGAQKLIRRVKDELLFINLVDIGKLKVFDEIAGQHMVAIYGKGEQSDEFIYKKLKNDLSDVGKDEDTENVTLKVLRNSDLFTENNQIELDADEVSYSKTVLLGSIFDVSQGVVQNPDKVSKKMAARHNLPSGDGVFVLTEDELSALNLTASEHAFVRLFFDERDIYKYFVRARSNKHLLYITKENCPDISQYPNLKMHLEKYKKIMLDRRETKKGLNKWFHIHWPRKNKYFEGPKIVMPAMFDMPSVGYQERSGYFGLSSNIIIEKDARYELKYLLAVLNSSFAYYWFHKHGKKRGVGVDIGVSKLNEFPIRKPTNAQQKNLVEITNKILTISKSDDYLGTLAKQARVRKFEKQIDQLVYKLYNLTPEEIKIVEKSTSGKKSKKK